MNVTTTAANSVVAISTIINTRIISAFALAVHPRCANILLSYSCHLRSGLSTVVLNEYCIVHTLTYVFLANRMIAGTRNTRKLSYRKDDRAMHPIYRVSQNKTPQHENRHICVTP